MEQAWEKVQTEQISKTDEIVPGVDYKSKDLQQAKLAKGKQVWDRCQME